MNESLGALIGLSNIVTRSRTRVAPGPDLDRALSLRDRLRTRALRALEGRESYIEDAVVAGRRIRLFSNSHHLADFWKENFFSPADELSRTGRRAGPEPDLVVYAAIDLEGEAEGSYTSASKREVFVLNTSYFGDLRATTLEALAPTVAGEGQLLHAAAIQASGRSRLLLYPKEIIHPTPTWGLMELPGSAFLADGWVFVDAQNRVWPAEKGFYFRTQALESYPQFASRLLRAKFENVPDATPELLGEKRGNLDATLEAALRNDPRHALKALPAERARNFIQRLIASGESRGIADPGTLFGKSGLARAPLEVGSVFVLEAGPGEPFREVSIERFPCPAFEVHTGAVKGHPRELARLIASR
jgi:hypothetical protein